MGKMQRTKGKVFERLIRQAFGAMITDFQHHGHSEADAVLRVGDRDITVECKNHQTLALPEWWRQACADRDAIDADHCVIVHKRKGATDGDQQWVTMDLATFRKMMQDWDLDQRDRWERRC